MTGLRWDPRLAMMVRERAPVSPAAQRLDAAMLPEGLELTHFYTDTAAGQTFELREYGDPLDGRAFLVFADGRVEETDR